MSSWQLAPSCTHQGLPANAAEPSSPLIGTDRSFCQLWLSRDTVREMSKTTRRGAPRRGEPSARDRLIETAIELFLPGRHSRYWHRYGDRAIRPGKIFTLSHLSVQ